MLSGEYFKPPQPPATMDFTEIKLTQFTETQKELMQKFNMAFYEAQSKSMEREILENFDEKYFNDIESYENDTAEDILEFLLPPKNCPEDGESFDYGDFSETFERVHSKEAAARRGSLSTETVFSTETSEYLDAENYGFDFDYKILHNYDQEKLELSEIDLSESVSSSSLDLDEVTYDFDGFDDCQGSVKLPPVETITKSFKFNSMIRHSNVDSLEFDPSEAQTNSFGHLLGQEILNNNENYIFENVDVYAEDNQAVMTQNEALIYDDPLLSSTSVINSKVAQSSDGERFENAAEDFENTEGALSKLQCKWEDCYQTYNSQTALVKHIEKSHVEMKRGEEFTCFWINCPRKSKPFNARYKLLIHMRVHSGEKPNKCPFQGCNKAFSRLENLKIHQRSHTGERPYLCQFSNCFKSFSNSSDRAKHQRTHYDTKPYACQVTGCSKKYTDPSSLRKHVKNHTADEQLEVKRKSMESKQRESYQPPRKPTTSNRLQSYQPKTFYTNLEHNYSNNFPNGTCIKTSSVKQDLKLKLNEKFNKERQVLLN